MLNAFSPLHPSLQCEPIFVYGRSSPGLWTGRKDWKQVYTLLKSCPLSPIFFKIGITIISLNASGNTSSACDLLNSFDALDLLVDQYNNAIHSSIKMTPKEASRKENENKVCRNIYREFGDKTLTPTFSIGDHVRITKKKENI